MIRRKGPRLAFEHRIVALGLLTALPGSLLALLLLWNGDFSGKTRWTLSLVLVLGSWLALSALRRNVVWPLQTLSNLLGALREGDFSFRARGARHDDVQGDVLREVNELAATLREQRLGALEAAALLSKVMAEIDVAIFAFDEETRLRLVNRAGEKLLGRPGERLLGRTAAEIGLDDCVAEQPPALLERELAGGPGRWEVRSSSFRQGGLPMRMLVLSDVSRTLRREERKAWQRLIRVFSHEVNNSLTPIQSIADSLRRLLRRDPLPADWLDDVLRGLEVVAARSEGLNRFLEAYARLARLPEPRLRPTDLAALVQRAARLETRLGVAIEPGPPLEVNADADQLEQALINLLRNAVDAALLTGGGVRVGWKRAGGDAEVFVVDEGPGFSNAANVFVPFFTTKPGGSGIGLVLSRQIAEAHRGELIVGNRADGKGCEARLRLPL
jgi:nitrogen fixation/metabolism regulation signal transduction histidine kinase